MIRLIPEDAESPIDLLEHEQADEAVRDRQPAERDQLLRARAQRVAVAIGAADREHDGRAAAAQLLGAEELVGELEARDRRAALVERVEVRAGGERREEAGLVLDLADVERAVRAEALPVLVLGGDEVGLLQPPDGEQGDLQRRASPRGASSSASPSP